MTIENSTDRTTGTATAGDAARSTTFEAPSPLHLLFTNLTSSPDRAAGAVLAGEFAASGIGDLGNLFRLIQKLDRDNSTEAFSGLIEIGSVLWAAGHLQAAVTLIEQALMRLDVPPIYEDRMRSIVADGHAEMLIVEAEKNFAAGDSEKALRLASQIKTDEMQQYSRDLSERSRRRRRGRIAAFTASGVAMTCLFGFFISGVFSAVELVRDPPEFTLPEFPDTSAIRTIASQGIDTLRDGTLPSVTSAAGPSTNPSVIPGVSDDQLGLPNQAATDDFDELTEEEVQATIAALSELPGYTCALGQAITTKAINDAPAQLDASGQETVAMFAITVKEGCDQVGVSDDELELLMMQIPDVIVAGFLEQLLEKGFAE
jgi:hypothetical protein